MGEDLKAPKEQKMPEIKDHIAHVFRTYAEALRECKSFKRDHEEDIVRINKTDALVIVFTKDKNLHYFMSENHYYQWSLGRTYTLDGKKTHSGYEVQ